jgi:nitrite reductase (NADH) small subunit
MTLKPSAQGSLAKTPFPHLLLHTHGRALSGTLGYGADTGWRVAWIYDGEVVTCPWHALEFHVPTGRCIAFSDIRLRKFEVRVSDGEIEVVV